MVVRGRFAPSPTGQLHLGNARTALFAWLDARAAGGAFLMRIEDLDRARVQPGAEAQQLDELHWLGLDWDEGPDRGGPHAPYRQSERTAAYDAAIERLLAAGRAFLCACSRADVASSLLSDSSLARFAASSASRVISSSECDEPRASSSIARR